MNTSLSMLSRLKAALCVVPLVVVSIVLSGCASEKTAGGEASSKPEAAAAPAAPPATAPAAEPAAVPAASDAVASAEQRFKEYAAKASAAFEGEGWEALLDGETLKGWRETAFAGRGDVECRSGLVVLNMGNPFTGVNYTNEFPKMNYEVALDAMRVMGSDFFCGLTIPVGETFCSLIVGGWGGALVGISSLDSMDASENETTKYVNFEQGRWYRIRLRITEGRIEGWIDNEKLINVLTTDRRISTRPGDIEMSKPFGIASWQTGSAIRQVKVRRVDKAEGPPKKF